MTDATIHSACARGDIDRVRGLIAADPAVVDADDEHQWRPIFHAALWRHVDVVRLLIESGADISAHDGYVLHYGAEVPDNKAIVTMLVQHGALEAHVRPTSDLSRQFLVALYFGQTQRVKAMLSRHPHLATETDGIGDQPILHASRNGDTDIVRMLLDAGADPNQVNPRGHTVLYCAGGHGHLETVRLLLDRGADADARFTDDGKNLLQWLEQFSEDSRYQPIAALLRDLK